MKDRGRVERITMPMTQLATSAMRTSTASASVDQLGSSRVAARVGEKTPGDYRPVHTHPTTARNRIDAPLGLDSTTIRCPLSLTIAARIMDGFMHRQFVAVCATIGMCW